MSRSHGTVRVRVFWSLVIFIICWTTWVLVRASDELRGGQIVQGLTRTYLPPYQHALGWVIDPRSTRLSDELVARYGPELASIPNEPWQKTLRRIGLRLGQFKKTAVLKQPSLLVHQDRKMPDLWIGRFGLKHVMFRDSIGVLTVDELPAYSSVIRLEGVDMPK